MKCSSGACDNGWWLRNSRQWRMNEGGWKWVWDVPDSEVKSDVTYSQVRWPILGICVLHLPIQSAHTQQWTHTLWTHTHCEHTPGAVARVYKPILSLIISQTFVRVWRGSVVMLYGRAEECYNIWPIYLSDRMPLWLKIWAGYQTL